MFLTQTLMLYPCFRHRLKGVLPMVVQLVGNMLVVCHHFSGFNFFWQLLKQVTEHSNNCVLFALSYKLSVGTEYFLVHRDFHGDKLSSGTRSA